MASSKSSREPSGRFPPGAITKMRELRAEDWSFRQIADRFATDEATVWRHANDVVVNKQGSLGSSIPSGYGMTSATPLQLTQTKPIFAGTLAVSRAHLGWIPIDVPGNVQNPTLYFAASGSTFDVQVLTSQQVKQFAPSPPPEPPWKPGEVRFAHIPHPRFWEVCRVRRVVKELSLPYVGQRWYLVFQNPSESEGEDENPIEVDVKLTTTRNESTYL